MSRLFSIDDETGSRIAASVPESEVWGVAQEAADRLGRPVYVYKRGGNKMDILEVVPSARPPRLRTHPNYPNFAGNAMRFPSATGKNRTQTNREDLTWSEWLRAAGVSEDDLASFNAVTEAQLAALRDAWTAGEDPTEWRAAGQRRKRRSRNNNVSDFRAFASNATDRQLEAILEKEWEGFQRNPARKSDYGDAAAEAKSRGWTIRRGQRIG